ncbi:hypothetical protein DBR13_18740, partial [Aeromonas sp. HMWF015]
VALISILFIEFSLLCHFDFLHLGPASAGLGSSAYWGNLPVGVCMRRKLRAFWSSLLEKE